MDGDLPLFLSVPSAVGPLLGLSQLLGQREDKFAASSLHHCRIEKLSEGQAG